MLATCGAYIYFVIYDLSYRESHVRMYSVDTQILNGRHSWIQLGVQHTGKF